VAGQGNLIPDGPLHGFFVRRPGGKLHDLGTLGGEQSFVWSMNDWNDVVGEAQLPDGDTWHAFVALHGRLPLRDLGTLGGSFSAASHVSDSGLVVGGSSRADGATHAFLGRVQGGELMDLGALVNWSFATSVNDLGTIVGRSDTPEGLWTAFVIASPGMPMIELSTVTRGLPPGVGLAEATDINSRGEITAVGTDNRSYLLRPSSRDIP
jgi:probable HAF family extracellular repeat protein